MVSIMRTGVRIWAMSFEHTSGVACVGAWGGAIAGGVGTLWCNINDPVDASTRTPCGIAGGSVAGALAAPAVLWAFPFAMAAGAVSWTWTAVKGRSALPRPS
jgi:hypothetical protein